MLRDMQTAAVHFLNEECNFRHRPGTRDHLCIRIVFSIHFSNCEFIEVAVAALELFRLAFSQAQALDRG